MSGERHKTGINVYLHNFPIAHMKCFFFSAALEQIIFGTLA